MNEPSATVVVATRDRPQWIEGAVRSALAQTIRDIEVIVVDDGSGEPVRLEIDDPRLRVERLPRSLGTCEARNRGLALARGRWVTFLDDDDRLAPDMLERCLEVARNSTLAPPVAVLSAAEAIDGEGNVVGTRGTRPRLPRGALAYLSGEKGPGFENALVVPTALLRAAGGYDHATHPWELHDLLLTLDPLCSIDVSETVGYRQTDHLGPRRSRDLLGSAVALERIVAKHRDAFARYPPARAWFLAVAGGFYLREGRWLRAVRASSRAVVAGRLRPRLLAMWLASLAGPALLAVTRRFPRATSGPLRWAGLSVGPRPGGVAPPGYRVLDGPNL